MKIFSVKDLPYIPAGHEDDNNPGVLKKVIFTVDDVEIRGHIQMINWAKMKPGKSFARHYHENMDEVFIIVSGKAEISVNNETSSIEATDAVYIPQKAEHIMKNLTDKDLIYIAIGIVDKPGGKTIVIE